jgi:hypothetical protein
MAVFALISDNPHPALRVAIERLFPGKFYHVNDRVSMVRASGTAKSFAEALGVKTRHADGRITGTISDVIITQLAPSYWGWAAADLWLWLQEAHQADTQ